MELILPRKSIERLVFFSWFLFSFLYFAVDKKLISLKLRDDGFVWRSRETIGNASLFVLHIPKTGGQSLRLDLEKLNRSKAENRFVMLEEESFMHRPVYTFENRLISVVRDPLKHVLSMYKHCTESEPARRRKTNMPSFSEWVLYWKERVKNSISRNVELQHFSQRPRVIYGYFGYANNKFTCYVPVNLQATRFGLIHMEGGNSDIMNRIGRTMFHVTVTEDYHRSFCILLYKLNPNNIADFCKCPTLSDVSLSHGRHGVLPYDAGAIFGNNTQAAKDSIFITDIDRMMYKVARDRMNWEVNYIRRNYDSSFFKCKLINPIVNDTSAKLSLPSLTQESQKVLSRSKGNRVPTRLVKAKVYELSSRLNLSLSAVPQKGLRRRKVSRAPTKLIKSTFNHLETKVNLSSPTERPSNSAKK